MTATATPRPRTTTRKQKASQTAPAESPTEPLDPREHDALLADLESARRRWLAEGDTEECVAEYARVLRALVGQAPPSR